MPSYTKTQMQLQPNDVHVWSTCLAITPEQEKIKFALLSQDERERARRFHSPIHQMHYIAARSGLRSILAKYLLIAPDEIRFIYSAEKKPSLAEPHSYLQFNVAHSHDYAMYGITLKHQIGVDIEKVRSTFNDDVAKRYFSKEEYNALSACDDEEKIMTFYRLWARKEALTKALGKGLTLPFGSFSVAADARKESILLLNDTWTLQSLPLHPDYQAAIATNQLIHAIYYWNYF